MAVKLNDVTFAWVCSEMLIDSQHLSVSGAICNHTQKASEALFITAVVFPINAF